MQQLLKVKSIFLKSNFQNGTYRWQMKDSYGKVIWEGEEFKLLPGDSAGLQFPKEAQVWLEFE